MESDATNGMVVNAFGGVVNKNIIVVGSDLEGNGPGTATNGQDVLTTVAPTSISASSQLPTARQLVNLFTGRKCDGQR